MYALLWQFFGLSGQSSKLKASMGQNYDKSHEVKLRLYM